MKRILFVIWICCVSVIVSQETNYKFKVFSPQLVSQSKNFNISVIFKVDRSVDSIIINLSSDKKFKILKSNFRTASFLKSEILNKIEKNSDLNNYTVKLPVKINSDLDFETVQVVFTLKGITKKIEISPNISIKDTSGNIFDFSPDAEIDSKFYVQPVIIKTYQVQSQAGKSLLFKYGSELNIEVNKIDEVNSLLIEFWGKFNGPLNNFFTIQEKNNSRSILSFSSNELQIFSPSFDKENEIFNDCSLINKAWHHFSILMNKKENTIDVYLDDKKSCSSFDNNFFDVKDILLNFKNNSENDEYQLDLLKIWDFNGNIEKTFFNKHFIHYAVDSSKVLRIFDFDEDRLDTENNSIQLKEISFVNSDAPIFSPTPTLNISVNSNYNSLDWKGNEYSSAKSYVLQKSVKGEVFQDIYETDVDNDPTKIFYFSDANNLNHKNGVIYYRLKQVNKDGTISYSQILKVGKAVQEEFILEQNYPNPFNPTTSINFEVIRPGDYEVIIYDLVGNKVANLFKGNLGSGKHSFRFDGSDLPSGIYFYEVKAPHSNLVHKMILAK